MPGGTIHQFKPASQPLWMRATFKGTEIPPLIQLQHEAPVPHSGDPQIADLAAGAREVFKAAANGIGFTKLVKKGKRVTARGGHLADLIASDA